MRQTLYDGYLVIFALAQAVILLMLTPLFTGISRQIRARASPVVTATVMRG